MTTELCCFAVSLTPCQKRQERAQQLSAGGPDAWIFVPRCQDDGSYHEVQCFPSTGQCWCVDINGNERWGTLMQGRPDCSGILKSSIIVMLYWMHLVHQMNDPLRIGEL